MIANEYYPLIHSPFCWEVKLEHNSANATNKPELEFPATDEHNFMEICRR
jgi:hypothetical protein